MSLADRRFRVRLGTGVAVVLSLACAEATQARTVDVGGAGPQASPFRSTMQIGLEAPRPLESYKVAGRLGTVLKGAAIGSRVMRKQGSHSEDAGDDEEHQAEADAPADAQTEHAAENPAQPAPAAREHPPGHAAAAPAPESTPVAPPNTDTSCFAGCYTPTSAEVRVPSRRQGKATAPSLPVGAAVRANSFECVAGCGGVEAPRGNAATTASEGSGDARTDGRGNGKITVLRGVTRARIYSVPQ